MKYSLFQGMMYIDLLCNEKRENIKKELRMVILNEAPTYLLNLSISLLAQKKWT